MRILLVNDDGYQALFFRLLVKNLIQQSWISELKIVVPDKEQSWRATSMRGLGEIHPRETELEGRKITLIDGTPADCVDWGVRYLFSTPPDFVLSGVNGGENTGLGFVISSGTLGACFHANVMSPPIAGVAISQCFYDMDFYHRIKKGEISSKEREKLETNLYQGLELIWQELQSQNDFSVSNNTKPYTWSFNIPRRLADNASVVEASIGDSRLGSCFVPSGDNSFRHSLVKYNHDETPKSDTQITRAGMISLSKIDLRRL